MAIYLTIKIPDEKIKNLKRALKRKGIEARSNAEAVNILIDNFLLSFDLKIEDPNQSQPQGVF